MKIPAGLFLPGVVVEVLSLDECDGELYPVESEAIARAAPRRRLEFTAGRTCARRALAGLGFQPGAIPRGAGREPVWPQGVTGSITHDREYCVAAVARSGAVRSIGIDLETDVRLPDSLIPDVCSTSELELFSRLDSPADCGWPKLLFSAKEAVFKCLYPLAGRMFEFDAVELGPGEERSSLRIRHADVPGMDERRIRSMGLRMVFPEGRILAGCWLS